MADRLAVTLYDDAAAFLERASEALAAAPVEATVVATNAQRQARRGPVGDAPYNWFATIERGGDVVGVAMRTAAFAPYPPYLMSMPDEAAVALGDALLERGEDLGGSNGARPAADVLARHVAGARGLSVSVGMHNRLFELGELVPPARMPAGALRLVRMDEAATALEWCEAFFRDADEQAGREAGDGHTGEAFSIDDVRRKIDEDVLWWWTDADGTPVHLIGANPPAFGVARIGPVFTPAEHRGKGYAGAATHAVSRQFLDAGARVSLFTDQANPVSNKLYEALGYQAVVDTIQLRIG